MLYFQHAEYLFVLLALPVILIAFMYVLRWKKRTAEKIGDPQLVQMQTPEYSPLRFRMKNLLVILAFVLCAFAVAGLVTPDETQRITRKGTDLMIALDVSKSMLATDIKPNRLERAKQLITKVVEQMPDEKVGLVVFAGRAYLQMPLTVDHSAAKMFISAVNTNDVPVQGTVISNALTMSVAAFNPQDKSYKSILLISDGEDHDRGASAVARDLAKQGVMVNTIGIGSPSGAPIPDEITGQYKIDKNGNTVISKLNEQALKSISDATGGIYQLYNDPDIIVKNLRNQLSGIETTTLTSDSSYLSFKQYFWYFLLAAFVLLCIEMVLSEKRRHVLRPVLLVFLLLGGLTKAGAQSANQEIHEGNQYFNQQDYGQAEARYQSALDKSPENSIASFNLGNAQFRKNDLEGAIRSYDRSIEHTQDNSVKQKAFYNKGVAYQTADKLPECIIAYKNALLLDPADEAARQNLQRALKRQEEQQQQNQSGNNQNKDNKKDQNQQQKQQQSERQPAPSAISKKDAEEKLKALADKEKDLQNRLQKMKGASSAQPEKDW